MIDFDVANDPDAAANAALHLASNFILPHQSYCQYGRFSILVLFLEGGLQLTPPLGFLVFHRILVVQWSGLSGKPVANAIPLSSSKV